MKNWYPLINLYSSSFSPCPQWFPKFALNWSHRVQNSLEKTIPQF
jgi:hypothetical protein